MTAPVALRPPTAGKPRPERAVSPAPPGRGGWLRRLLPYLWAHRAKVLVAFGAALVGQLIAGLTPVAEKIITDDVILTHRRSLTPWLVVLVAAGDRDPAQFADPHRFDVTRPDANRHIAFGSGIHFCLGAPLARVEAQVAVGTLARRFPELSLLDDDPPYSEMFTLRGVASLPVGL